MTAFRVLLALVIALWLGIPVNSLDYTLIQVGPANYPMSGPVRWSPDGAKLAFFQGKTLCISDTLGQMTKIAETEYIPRKFFWIDDSAVAVYHQERVPRGEWRAGRLEHNVISEIGLDGRQRILREQECVYDKNPRLDRLECAVHGTVYVYELYRGGRSNLAILSAYESGERESKAEADFVVGVNDKDIFKVYLGSGDTVSIWQNAKGYTTHKRYQRPLMSYDQKLMLVGRGALVILNLEDSSEVILNDYLGQTPEGYILCDFIDLSFCPTSRTLVFAKTCDKSDSESVVTICMYDYDTRTYTSFPSLTGAPLEMDPVMSATRHHIAFLSSKKGVCILRLSGIGVSDRDRRAIYA